MNQRRECVKSHWPAVAPSDGYERKEKKKKKVSESRGRNRESRHFPGHPRRASGETPRRCVAVAFYDVPPADGFLLDRRIANERERERA